MRRRPGVKGLTRHGDTPTGMILAQCLLLVADRECQVRGPVLHCPSSNFPTEREHPLADGWEGWRIAPSCLFLR